jgi:hypothetical protein
MTRWGFFHADGRMQSLIGTERNLYYDVVTATQISPVTF